MTISVTLIWHGVELFAGRMFISGVRGPYGTLGVWHAWQRDEAAALQGPGVDPWYPTEAAARAALETEVEKALMHKGNDDG